jgi:predicted dehydrogenase
MGHERRFEPPIAEMLAMAADGRLGRLLQIEANFSHDKFLSLDRGNWRRKPEQAPAGGMTATGIHLTDLAVKLMGPARDATLATPFFSRFAVFGTDGWIDVRDRAHVETADGWVVIKGLKGGPITVGEVGKAEPVVVNFEAFARAVRGVSPYPITGEDMINNIALLDAIVRGATSGRTEALQDLTRNAA